MKSEAFYVLVNCRERDVSNQVMDLFNDFSEYECVFDVLNDFSESIQRVKRNYYDLIFLEPEEAGGNTAGLLHEIQSAALKAPLILLTDKSNGALAEQAETVGVFDCFDKKDLDRKSYRKEVRYIIKMSGFKRKLENESLYLKYIMDKAPDGIFFKDVHGAYVRINKARADVLGIKEPGEATGKTDAFYYSGQHSERIFREEQEIIRTGQPLKNHECSRVVTHSNDQLIWTSTTKTPFYDKRGRIAGIFGFEKDITGHKILENEQEEGKKQVLYTLIDNIPDFIYVKNTSGRFILGNRALAEFMGAGSPEQLIGRSDFDFYPREIAEKFYNDEQMIIETKQPRINFLEMNMVKDQHNTRWVTSTKIPFYNSLGKVMGIMGISREVTELKRLTDQHNESLETLHKLFIETVRSISALLETRDAYTAGHQRRVAQLATAIGKEMQLPDKVIEGIYFASILHDIGKICVPAEILTKPGKLSEVEFALIKEHPAVGYNILKSIEFPWPIAKIVLQHHVRIDGSGYPANTPPSELLLESKIIMVSDIMEAISSHRPYRPALGMEKALEEITGRRGVFYDPEVVDACVRLFKGKGFRFDV